ncbi:uncharacterized protein PFL1_05198 [Pseudozyma flocculosa PF-1]|uniref:DUF3955 domain-containing protein n=2 Tax=Pseudozyma flocculosa TaxID=84751 RepID=A0A5C3F6J8_9BASI|nr:uncharacterized protein PFL1_05198 [Pseudozyma flocculosa PF-1]EPQ27275.1 hypothetical protein PFL1_05198 [Pseudozyma flocculosa PF-1]SPO39646.1 uncharacterized protein PSFLO_05127 [Pseudozyma flocculosa]
MSPSSSPNGDATAALHRRSEYLTGILLLLVVVILWTASNFLTNTVLTSGYDKPFFVTYANTSSFALYLVPFFLSTRLRAKVFGGARTDRLGALRLDAVGEADSESASEGWLKKLGFDLPPSPSGPGRDEGESEAERGTYRSVANDDRAAAPRSSSPLLSRPTSTYSTSARRISLTNAIRPNLDRPRSLRASNASLVSHSARPSSIDGRRPRTEIPVFAEIGEGDLTAAAIPPDTLPPLTLRQTAVLACQFTMVWFGANWSINAGLGLTSVASGTTIGSASGFFTLGLGALLGVDKFTVGRIGAVSMSFIGVMLVTAADAGSSMSGGGGAGGLVSASSSLVKRAVDGSGAADGPMATLTAAASPINAPLGDMLALLSAFLYSIYVMLLKVKIGSEDRISMPLMFGIVGAFNIVALWPIGVLLHVTGVETFALPQDARTWAGVVVNMSITLVSDLVYLMAMLKSSPLASTLGLSLTIPLAVAGDVYRGSHSGGRQAALGSILVLGSFVAIGIADNIALRDEASRYVSIGDEDEEDDDETLSQATTDEEQGSGGRRWSRSQDGEQQEQEHEEGAMRSNRDGASSPRLSREHAAVQGIEGDAAQPRGRRTQR